MLDVVHGAGVVDTNLRVGSWVVFRGAMRYNLFRLVPLPIFGGVSPLVSVETFASLISGILSEVLSKGVESIEIHRFSGSAPSGN